ncbi:MAG: alpha/beta hydrolase family protein [Corynebacterium sp.]|nr:alpha/beta hydrolase family protein [Corynebacterium sp.]
MVAHAGTSAQELAGDTPLATITIGANASVTPKWRPYVQGYGSRVQEMWAYSPSMSRFVPLVVIRAKEANAPTIYLLNGGDGGEGIANWVMQTDVIEFYLQKNVNVVIPMTGKFSYYADWAAENTNLGGKQYWETFLTKELPVPMEELLEANGKRAIMGMSMTATTTLLYAEHNPGFYDAIGSFSGCAQTNDPLGRAALALTLQRGGATPEQMYGPMNSEYALYQDALVNAEKLRGTTIYVSNATGLAGKWDLWSSPRIQFNSLGVMVNTVEGGIIEATTNICTHNLAAKLKSYNIPATFNFRTTGTHSWGYWWDDIQESWPVIAPAIGAEV